MKIHPLKRKRRSELKGGAKTREGTVYREKYISCGDEGWVNKVKVKVKYKGRERLVPLTEKIFWREYYETNPSVAFRNPLEQIRRIRELKRVNKEKNLGLRIVPTIRLRKHADGTYSLLTTRLKTVERVDLNEKEQREYKMDEARQRNAAREAGYFIGEDAFFAIKEGRKILAVIADFGMIKYRTKEARGGQEKNPFP